VSAFLLPPPAFSSCVVLVLMRTICCCRFGDVEPDRVTWKEAHRLFLCAFCEPSTPQEKKRLARVLKKPIIESVNCEFFDYDAFLRGLGRMSLSKSLSQNY
jgi:hypothetical protein